MLLACGPDAHRPAWAALRGYPGVDWREVPAVPGKPDLEPVLAAGREQRLVVFGTDSALSAVVTRLLRTGRFGEVAVGFVPLDHRRSTVARLWGLPRKPALALATAVDGEIARLPLIRTDAGGVLLGRGSVQDVNGEAYCDDQLALRGRAYLITVEPDLTGGPGLTATILRSWRRSRVYEGRAFQVGCHPALLTNDEEPHQSVRRWTWYRHTEDLRAAR